MNKEQAIYEAYKHDVAKPGFVRVWEDDGQDGGWWENITEEEFQKREEQREAEERERALTHADEDWFNLGYRQ